MEKLKTAEEAKSEIRRDGLTIAKWAVKNGLSPSTVYAVLKGKVQGNYGEVHKAAVLLGMKEGRVEGREQEPELKRA